MSALRVALVRGPFLNPFDVAQYTRLGAGFDVVGIGARRTFTESEGMPIPVRRLRCPETEISVRHGRTLNMATWFLGRGYLLAGFDAAVADCDVIHTAETYFGFSLQAARAARRREIPLVVTVKETIAYVEAFHPMRRHGLEPATKREVRAAATHYIAVSKAAATALRIEGVEAGRVTVVLPAVDVDRFARPHVPGKTLRILFVGPAVWRKGLFDALTALALVRRHLPATMTVVGRGGGDEATGRRLADDLGIAGAVQWEGTIPHAAMPDLLARHDVLLAPSIPTRTWQEQDSMAVVEAMAAGLPVVATPGGVRQELLGDDGWWMAPGDPGEAVDRLLEIADAPQSTAERAARLQQRARREHDLALAGSRIAAVYRAAVAR